MDIPVSRLNKRMALQLPAELPLGLVFVVGQVRMPGAAEAGLPGDFYLGDDEYRLPCRLSERAANEVRLSEGDKIRAGGHLVFEAARASYYLLARDVEHLDSLRPPMKPLTAIIADNYRREKAASLAQADLPPWVQQMAPPELRSPRPDQTLGTQMPAARSPAADLMRPSPGAGSDWDLLADAQSAMAYPDAEPTLAEMSDELIAFLSQAMDSEVEVELTSEIMTDLNTTGTTDLVPPELLQALDDIEATVKQPAAPPASQSNLLDLLPAQTDQGQAPADQPEMPVASHGLMESLLALERAAYQHIAPAETDASEQEAEAVDAQESGDAPERVAMPEAVSEPVKPQPAGPPPERQAQAAAKAPRLIPWYVVLLVIVLFAAILLALGLVLVFPQGLPFELPLDLPADLPFAG